MLLSARRSLPRRFDALRGLALRRYSSASLRSAVPWRSLTFRRRTSAVNRFTALCRYFTYHTTSLLYLRHTSRGLPVRSATMPTPMPFAVLCFAWPYHAVPDFSLPCLSPACRHDSTPRHLVAVLHSADARLGLSLHRWCVAVLPAPRQCHTARFSTTRSSTFTLPCFTMPAPFRTVPSGAAAIHFPAVQGRCCSLLLTAIQCQCSS